MILSVIKFDLQYNFLDKPGQRAGFVVLAAFLGTFLFIRTSARLMRSPKVTWWPGSVTTDSGLHLHHLVWGIVLIMLSGFVSFAVNAVSPWNEVLAAMFGIGCGLTLDEFALWIYLRDVYWAKEGRSSFDAVVMATVLGALIILGAAPLDLSNNAASLEVLILTVVIDVSLAVITILKGKPLMGMVGIFLVPFSVVGSVRLAAPRSPWARRFYDPDGKKIERSRDRWRRIQRRRRRVSDVIAGAPTPDTE
jgi:ABC-type multidrug transport system fused ATPase/permease subunit